jgi:iron only hydrogenase large subunit-like protein
MRQGVLYVLPYPFKIYKSSGRRISHIEGRDSGEPLNDSFSDFSYTSTYSDTVQSNFLEAAMTFEELYRGLLQASAQNRKDELLRVLQGQPMGNGIDCLLHPEKYAPVWNTAPCDCKGEGDPQCIKRCIFSAIRRSENGDLMIDKDRCAGCGACIEACTSGKLTESKDALPVLEALKNARGPVYAMVAPAFIGQFDGVSPGRLRSAFKSIGFTGMVEVALFADILTLKEALVFDKKIKSHEDFMLTSCCCPIWITMVRRSYSHYLKNLPDSVSPMIACGRVIKQLEPSAVTVFIGPCVAKKVEARNKELADAVDFVLTFEETRDIFEAFSLKPRDLPEDGKEHSSRAGRIYARTGGVSEAVERTVKVLNPNRSIHVKAAQADGTKDCRKLLEMLKDGRVDANFIEGMGCSGGCVGGPKALIDPGLGQKNVDRYGDTAACATPLDNPSVMKLLNHLGFNSVEKLLDENIFTRQFDDAGGK